MKTEYAILSLVRMHPDVTGYQLKSIVDHTTSRFTKLRLNKIYPALKNLTEQGMLAYREVPQPGRLPQKYYTLTEKGQNELDEWLCEPFEFSTDSDNFNDYLLKLGAMAYLEDQKIAESIDHGIEFLRNQYEFLGRDDRADLDLDYVRSTNEGDKERYSKLWTLEYRLMAEQVKTRLDQLIEIREHYK